MSRCARRLTAATLAVAAAGVAAGLALALRGGGAGRPTEAVYLAHSSAVCRRYAARLAGIPPPADPRSPAAVAAAVGRALPVLEEQAAAIRAIRPARALEERVRRLLGLTDRSLRRLQATLDAAKRRDPTAMGRAFGEWLAASEDAKTASVSLGLRC